MLANVKTAISMFGLRALTQFMSLIGDPIGRLEAAKDLPKFSASLRERKVHRSRIGVLITADYEICAEVLKSPNWRTYLEPRNFLEKSFIETTASNEIEIDLFLDSILGKDGAEHERIKKLVLPAFNPFSFK